MHYSEWPEDKKEKSREANRRWNARNKGKRKEYYDEYDRNRSQEDRMLRASKDRSRKDGIINTITIEDIQINMNCPICDREMFVAKGSGGGTSSSPTLDKVKPELGYIPGNVAVI